MDGAIYVLCREVPGDNGQKFGQTVSVFADSPSGARGIVAREFALLRQNSRSEERAYGTMPAWRVDKVSLDAHKVITSTVTT